MIGNFIGSAIGEAFADNGQSLTADLFANVNAFFGPVVVQSGNLGADLFVNDNTFHAVTVSPGSVSLTPDLYEDGDTFHAAVAVFGSVVTPDRFVNANAFFAPTVTRGTVTIEPPLHDDGVQFYTATVSRFAPIIRPIRSSGIIVAGRGRTSITGTRLHT